jgi:hypothetical protein
MSTCINHITINSPAYYAPTNKMAATLPERVVVRRINSIFYTEVTVSFLDGRSKRLDARESQDILCVPCYERAYGTPNESFTAENAADLAVLLVEASSEARAALRKLISSKIEARREKNAQS